MKQIEVIVDKSGVVTLTTSGYSGLECLEASRVLEELIGDAISTEHTTEMSLYETEVVMASQG